MNFFKMKKASSIIVLGLIVLFIMYASKYAQILAPLNGFIYDHIMVSIPKLKKTLRPNLVLIQGTSKFRMAGDSSLLVLLTEIEKQHPKSVVFTFLPTEVSKQFYEDANRYGNVIFGRRIDENSNSEHDEFLERMPEATKGIQLLFGVIQLPDTEHGVYRFQKKWINVKGDWYPTLEVASAKYTLKKSFLPIGNETYRIDFSRSKSSFPVLSMEQILNGNLVPSLIKDHVVLVGVSNTAGNFIYTPLMIQHDSLTPLQFYAYSLETLLSNNAIIDVGGFWDFIIIFVIIVISIYVFKKVQYRYQFLFLICVLALYLFVTWVFLDLLNIWLPIVDMVVAQILIWLSLIYSRYKLEVNEVQRLMIKIGADLRGRSIPEYFYNSEEPWKKINNMVGLLTRMDLSIFLECDKEEHKLNVVTASGCDSSLISERRRDYRRKPYSDAIERKKIIEVTNFILTNDKNKNHFIMPLIFLNEVQGFWIFSLQDNHGLGEKVEFYLNNLGRKISELLYIRAQWIYQNQIKNRTIRQYFEFYSETKFLRDIKKLLGIVDHHFTLMEDYLNHTNVASIVYDLFGQPVIVNKKMSLLLKYEDEMIHRKSMLEFISSLTGLDETYCQSVFQSLLLDNEELKFDVQLPSQKERSFILNISGVNTMNQVEGSDSTQDNLIERRAFLCNLIDVTEIKQAYSLKDTVRKHLGYQFRNDLSSILFATSLLENKTIGEEKRKRMLEILRSKSNAIAARVYEAEELFSVNISVSQIERYPVDLTQAMNNAVSSFKDEAFKKGVHFDAYFPEVTKLVYASPNMLHWVLCVLIRFLLADSIFDGKINIHSEIKNNYVFLNLSNQGHGLPNDLLQSYLSNLTKIDENKNLSDLKQAIAIVHSWDGELLCGSNVAVGSTFLLKLRSYL